MSIQDQVESEEKTSLGDALEKKKNRRITISFKIYLGLATFVFLILVATLLGRNSFSELNSLQKTITEERIPELSLAIRMSQKSVALMSTAPMLLSAKNKRELEEINTLIQNNSKDLAAILNDLNSRNQGNSSNSVYKKYSPLSRQLTQNLESLRKSVDKKLRMEEQLKISFVKSLQLIQEINQQLISEIDDQTFFLYTGWKTLNQKKPAPLSQRVRKNSLDYYRSLLSLKAQTQRASNLLSQTVYLTDPGLLQSFRERFQAELDNCKDSLRLLGNKSVKNRNLDRIQSLKKLSFDNSPASLALFPTLEKIFKEKKVQQEYLSTNQKIVQNLTSQIQKMIQLIEGAGAQTTETFSKTIEKRTRQFGFLNIFSIILALATGFFLVYRHLVARIKKLSNAMIFMSEGNLKVPLVLKGNDEITDMGRALEVFRRYALEAQELQLVQKLAQEVNEKNSELEGAISKLKKAQKQIIMQEKLASLGQLTSGIAHEIKNPLNFITNFSSISKELLEDLSRELAEPENKITADSQSFIEDTLKDLHGNMEKINNHGQRANDIVKGMLQHSREEVKDNKEVIQIKRFLDSCVNLAYQGKRSSGSNFNVDFKKEYSDQLDKVEINPQDISRVVLNLVTNAFDALEEKSKKLPPKESDTFEPCIWIKAQDDGGYLQIQVADNGFGIPEEKKKRIFDPFFTTKPTDKGTGLGLSLSHDIALKHGGSLQASSSASGGAAFTLRIPLHNSPA